MAVTVAVRAPRDRDLDAMADQAGQLGYPVEPDELRRRLAAVTANDDAAVLVATDPQDRAIGWLHVELKRTLVAPLTAQIMALIVDERARGGGVGRELVAAADAWAAGAWLPAPDRGDPGHPRAGASVLSARGLQPGQDLAHLREVAGQVTGWRRRAATPSTQRRSARRLKRCHFPCSLMVASSKASPQKIGSHATAKVMVGRVAALEEAVVGEDLDAPCMGVPVAREVDGTKPVDHEAPDPLLKLDVDERELDVRRRCR